MSEHGHDRNILDGRKVSRDHHSALSDIEWQTFVPGKLYQKATGP
jgi:hypothetical protein